MISIVIPCYNEGLKLVENIKKVNKYMNENIKEEYEILIINDGSRDDTLKILNENQSSFENTKILSYSENKGKGYAVKTGLLSSSGDYTIFMDADLSTELEAIKKVVDVFENNNEYDIVIANRRMNPDEKEKKGFLRKLLSKGFYIVTFIFTGLKYTDTQCGFKGFKTSIAKDIAHKQTLERFAFDVEYLYIAKLNNYKVKEIPVIWINDPDSRVKVVRDSIRMFKDILTISKNKKKYI